MFRPISGWAIIRLRLEYRIKLIYYNVDIKNGGTRSRFTIFGDVRSYIYAPWNLWFHGFHIAYIFNTIICSNFGILHGTCQNCCHIPDLNTWMSIDCTLLTCRQKMSRYTKQTLRDNTSHSTSFYILFTIFCREKVIRTVSHISHSPDMALCDLQVFLVLKNELKYSP
jgi:hypothetical protein